MDSTKVLINLDHRVYLVRYEAIKKVEIQANGRSPDKVDTA